MGNLEQKSPGAPAGCLALHGSRARPGGALVVNIFGGPGAGKSTLASRLFYELKKSGIEAACPEEHAKLALWSGQPWLLDQQIVLLGRSWETLHALHDKVDVVIVDSPILLCSIYAGDREPSCFHELAADVHKRLDRLNLVIERDQSRRYSHLGRRENAVEAERVDQRILDTLDQRQEPYLRATPQAENISSIVIQHLDYLRSTA